MSEARYRPLLQSGEPRPDEALPLAGGPLWFDQVVVHEAGRSQVVCAASDVPLATRERLVRPREPICGMDWSRPCLMGILNVTPDSFSDGGRHSSTEAAVAQAQRLAEAGAEIIDIGGESTRPGAETVPETEELERVVPVIAALRRAGFRHPISVDTRKAGVARAALGAGADLVNDVSALSYDPDMERLARETALPLCLMHARGDPKTMQDRPTYDDVVLDIYDWFDALLDRCETAGIPRCRVLVDPGIGFGKTEAHNLELIRNLAIFHGLGAPLLVGASRKRFIGAIGHEPDAAARAPGSIAVALEALRQGAQMIRIHDVKETRQAVSLWEALNGFG